MGEGSVGKEKDCWSSSFLFIYISFHLLGQKQLSRLANHEELVSHNRSSYSSPHKSNRIILDLSHPSKSTVRPSVVHEISSWHQFSGFWPYTANLQTTSARALSNESPSRLPSPEQKHIKTPQPHKTDKSFKELRLTKANNYAPPSSSTPP